MRTSSLLSRILNPKLFNYKCLTGTRFFLRNISIDSLWFLIFLASKILRRTDRKLFSGSLRTAFERNFVRLSLNLHFALQKEFKLLANLFCRLVGMTD
jgi:hypothetical protein